jgi:hypothetical protein
MTFSAVLFGALGVTGLFLPGEITDLIGFHPDATLPVQMFAGALCGMASLNWMGRGAVYGGIYGRPIVVGNLGFGLISASNLLSAATGGAAGSWAWVLAGLFGLHTLGFGRLMYRPPWPDGQNTGTKSPS